MSKPYDYAIGILEQLKPAKRSCLKTATANGGKCDCSQTVQSINRDMREINRTIRALKGLASPEPKQNNQ